jgi:hypothetical protein
MTEQVRYRLEQRLEGVVKGSVHENVMFSPDAVRSSERFTRAAPSTSGRAQKQIPMCSLRSLTCLQVQVLPRQWMVGPSSHSRLWLEETPAGASSAVNDTQRREGEADGPQGQRPAGVSRRGPSWTEFVRLADQAVVAIAGAEMINRAEPRACGHSRGSRRLDPEPETERTAGPE